MSPHDALRAAAREHLDAEAARARALSLYMDALLLDGRDDASVQRLADDLDAAETRARTALDALRGMLL